METLELQRLLRPLRRWWWLVLIATILAAFSSLIYSFQQPDVYQSRTTLIVGSTISDPNPSGADVYLMQQLAQAYAQMAQREPIRQATMEALGLEWLPYYAAYMVPNSQLIEVQVYSEDPTLARDVAAELARQLILFGPAGHEQQEREAFVDAQLAELQNGILDTRNEIRQKQQDLTTLFSAREIADTQSLIQALESKLSSLQATYAALLATTQRGAANTLSVLEPANLPTNPIDSNLSTDILVAAVLGCVLAAGGAYLIEFLDNSFKAVDEAQELLGAPVLTNVPLLSSGATDGKLVMVQPTPTPGMEAYRLLRVNLEFTSIDNPVKLIMVAGASAQDGKSLTAANLAAAYARAGKHVILLDADLHRPTQQQLFRLRNNIGLTTALRSNELPFDSLLQPTMVPGLRILTSGPLPPNPAELLGSKRMQEILAKLKGMADLLIVDSPPLTTVTDGIVLATQADGIVMVVRAGKTHRVRAQRACLLLSQVKANLLGIVFNGVAVKDSDYRADYGYYRYSKKERAVPASKLRQAAPDYDLTPERSNGVLTPQRVGKGGSPDEG
ncbi:MAG: polysaccharide biosynthesis tyrosine autokinase [Caldilineaceae bacterium]